MASSRSRPPKIVAALCNAPDDKTARALARRIVKNKLAACVNILPPCRSVYRWRGKTEEEKETPLIIKTARQNIPALKKAVREWHPYETPELVFLPVQDGLPDYLRWAAECES